MGFQRVCTIFKGALICLVGSVKVLVLPVEAFELLLSAVLMIAMLRIPTGIVILILTSIISNIR